MVILKVNHLGSLVNLVNQVMIDAMECNFNTFRTIEVKLELVSNDNNVVELPTSQVNED